jgi:uncharacterized protein
MRSIRDCLQDGMKYFPVVAVTGPRQSGKTTFLQDMFPNFKYVSLENPDSRSFAESDPNGFLKLYDQMVIIDEVQRVPELLSYIQTSVDKSKMMGQYIISGSQNFHLMRTITQSLAGRVGIFKLLPFDFAEMKAASILPYNYEELIVKGSYPAIYSRGTPIALFYRNYLETYVERDVTDLLSVKDIGLFRTFLKLCAGRVGQQLNITSLSKEATISIPTVKSWLSILETSYIIHQLPPFFKNFNKRLVKSPKLYFYDTGLASYLLGIKTVDALRTSNYKGALFENLIVNEYIKQNHHQNLDHDFYYWRDSNDREVDLLVSNKMKFDAVEIKATMTIMQKLFTNLDYIAKIGDNTINQKILVYGGDQSQRRTDYQVLAWTDLRISED